MKPRAHPYWDFGLIKNGLDNQLVRSCHFDYELVNFHIHVI